MRFLKLNFNYILNLLKYEDFRNWSTRNQNNYKRHYFQVFSELAGFLTLAFDSSLSQGDTWNAYNFDDYIFSWLVRDDIN